MMRYGWKLKKRKRNGSYNQITNIKKQKPIDNVNDI